MPGPEPTEPNENLGQDPRELAASIREDFRALIATLEGEMDLELDPDSEAMRSLWKAKAAAELGLQLSERLLRSIEG